MTTELTVRRESAVPTTTFTREQVELIKAQLCPGATDDELRFVVATAQHNGLDPFAMPRQMHALKIWNDDAKRYAWVPVISIDGLRVAAERTGRYEGQTAPQWTDDGVRWLDVWLSDDPPAAARVGVYRRGFREAIYGVARWRSFVQTAKGRDGKPYVRQRWREMPDHMLAKCAEAIALKKAFPQQLGSLRVSADAGRSALIDVDAELTTVEVEAERPIGRGAQAHRDLYPDEDVPAELLEREREVAETTNVEVRGDVDPETGEVIAAAQAELFGDDDPVRDSDPLMTAYDERFIRARELGIPNVEALPPGATRRQVLDEIQRIYRLEREHRTTIPRQRR